MGKITLKKKSHEANGTFKISSSILSQSHVYSQKNTHTPIPPATIKSVSMIKNQIQKKKKEELNPTWDICHSKSISKEILSKNLGKCRAIWLDKVITLHCDNTQTQHDFFNLKIKYNFNLPMFTHF